MTDAEAGESSLHDYSDETLSVTSAGMATPNHEHGIGHDRRGGADSPHHKSHRLFLTAESDRNARRVLHLGAVFLVLTALSLLLLLGRVIQLQWKPPNPIASLIGSQQSQTLLHGRRGSLLDRRGRTLACTRVAQRLFVDPLLIEDPGTFAEHLGYALGYDPAQIEKRVSQHSHRRYVVIDEQLNELRLQAFKQLRLKGAAIESRLVRDYPYGDLAGPVIGFVGRDGTGLEGLEHSWDAFLTGKVGRIRYLRDARRTPLWVEKAGYRPGSDGRSIRVSLDAVIQHIAESELSHACEAFSAKTGQMIVMDPSTGEILAMANHPPFAPARFKQTQPSQRRNRCVTDVYEPGSTFKPMIWAVATEAGLAKRDEVIDCTEAGYYVSPQGRSLRDAHAHGSLTWDEVLINSSNIGMAIVSQRMDPKQMHRAVRAFGFGSSTSSGFAGEAKGIITPIHRWNHYSMTSVPMGHEIAVTSLQMVRAYGAIANGGYLVTPTLEVSVPASNHMKEPSTQVYERVISAATAAQVRQVLRRVVVEGTARSANSRLYTIFGKTGTAQIPDRVNGGYMQDQYISSFIGAAPLEHPMVIVACVVDRPDKSKGHYGSTVAAPAVRAVIERTLTYLGVPQSIPDRTQPRLVLTAAAAPENQR